MHARRWMRGHSRKAARVSLSMGFQPSERSLQTSIRQVRAAESQSDATRVRRDARRAAFPPLCPCGDTLGQDVERQTTDRRGRIRKQERVGVDGLACRPGGRSGFAPVANPNIVSHSLCLPSGPEPGRTDVLCELSQCRHRCGARAIHPAYGAKLSGT